MTETKTKQFTLLKQNNFHGWSDPKRMTEVGNIIAEAGQFASLKLSNLKD
jgi:hypothetical protein